MPLVRGGFRILITPSVLTVPADNTTDKTSRGTQYEHQAAQYDDPDDEPQHGDPEEKPQREAAQAAQKVSKDGFDDLTARLETLKIEAQSGPETRGRAQRAQQRRPSWSSCHTAAGTGQREARGRSSAARR